MGAPVPGTVGIYPTRVHGLRHWLQYTVELYPVYYHVILKFQDAEGVDVGVADLMVDRGILARYCEDPQEKWDALVQIYENGKTPDEIVQLMEQNCVSQAFADAWRSHIPIPEEP